MALLRGLATSSRLLRNGMPFRREPLRQCFSSQPNAASENLEVSMDDATGIVSLRMKRKPANSLNHEMLTELNIILEKLENDRKCRGLIISSLVPRIFSAGLEISELYQPKKDRLRIFWRALQDFWMKLYGSRLVTAAAIAGHAPAGGCLIAVACDHRVMAAGKYTIGLNEVMLGFKAPSWLMANMTNTIGMHESEKALKFGTLYSPSDALKIGLVDEVVDETEVIESARCAIAQYLTVPDYARQLTKEAMRKPTLLGLIGREAEEVEAVVELLTQDECQQRIGEYLQALKSRKK